MNFKSRINYLTQHWGASGERTTKPPREVIHSKREAGLACVNRDYAPWLKDSATKKNNKKKPKFFFQSLAFMSGDENEMC